MLYPSFTVSRRMAGVDGAILTDLGGSQALFGQFKDLLLDIIRCEFQPLQSTLSRLQSAHFSSQTDICCRRFLCVCDMWLYTHSGNTAPVWQS